MALNRMDSLPAVLSVAGFDGRGRIIIEGGFDHGIELGLAVPARELLTSPRFAELAPRDQEMVRRVAVRAA